VSGGRFERCLAITFGEEGGKANVAGDHGGPTNMGITAATLAEARNRGLVRLGATIDNLRREEAERIYFHLYWTPARCPEFPAPLDACLFDAYVNHRPHVAARLIQAAVGAEQDGIVGPATIRLAHAAELVGAVNRYAQERTSLYHAIVAADPTQQKFLHGWLNRVEHVKATALAELA
jgi:lysozyme family protein